MKTYLRLLSDRQTTVVTVPSLDFNSLHDQSLRYLAKLFGHLVERVVGQTVILDVTPVKTAGAGFLTEVHRFATALAQKHVQLVLAGDLGGLFHLVGWERRFRLYDSLVAALSAWAEWRSPNDSEYPVQHAPLNSLNPGQRLSSDFRPLSVTELPVGNPVADDLPIQRQSQPESPRALA